MAVILYSCSYNSPDYPPFESCQVEMKRLVTGNFERKLTALNRLEGCERTLTTNLIAKRLIEEPDVEMRYFLASKYRKFDQPGSGTLQVLVNSKLPFERYLFALAVGKSHLGSYLQLAQDPDPQVRLAFARRIRTQFPTLVKEMVKNETNHKRKELLLSILASKVLSERKLRTISEVLRDEQQSNFSEVP
ncbi:MAG: hypothetical protein SFX74_08565 [Fimbriimonadaceae bacterium]|nr:hypothetical protein [Fimbriimonadaceae bacterium]